MSTMRKNVATRINAIMLCIALLLSTIPVSVTNAFAVTADMGTLSGITAGGTLTGENGANAVITYSNATLEWSAADPSIGRNVDGWWVGIKMTAPADMLKQDDFTNVTYQRCTSAANGTWTKATSFWEAQDSDKNVESTERYLTMWGVVNEQYLNDAIVNGKTVNYIYRFDWNGDGTYEQTATLQIDPEGIKLNKSGSQVYPSTVGNGTVSALSDGLTVNNADFNYVEVVYNSNVTLKWTEKDTTVGRLNDGWWAGMKITAPNTLKVEADFNGVTYQRKDGEAWITKNFWNVKDSKDTDTTHFLTMWGLINESILEFANSKETNKTANYTYRFDWNKDGVYEQTVVLKINPVNITLLDKNEVQVYPKLGTVAALSGGSVEGSATGKVTVNVSDVALNWSAKDESVGRNYDAWWAGAKITAPEGSTATTLANAKYRNRATSSTAASGWNDWTSAKKFLDYKDGNYYINVWTSADRQLVEKYINKGMKIQSQYEFDWDGNGSYDQVVTISIDPTTVTLNRVDRTDFVFADSANGKEVWVADGSLTNKAESIKTPGTVTYEIDTANTTVTGAQVDNAGKVTFNTIGKITVKATIAEDDVYNAKTISYSFNVVKKQPENLTFAIEQPSDITYGQNENIFENAIKVPEDCKVEYSIKTQEKLETADSAVSSENPVATIDKDTGKITIKRSGEITVVATITDDDPKYKDKSAEYTLTINKADQTGFAFTANSPESFVYSTTAYDTVKVEGGQVDGAAIKYEITEGTDIAEVVNTNSIKTLKSGKFTLSVTKSGNDCYKPITIKREMEVTLAEQTTFAFTYPTPNSITYNENGNKYENVAIEGESTGKVTYKVVVGNDVADFENADKPAELTIKKAGTIKVEATKAADDKYAARTISYQITVERAEQAFTFADGAAVVKNYGIKEYINNVIPTVVASKADGIGHGEGVITYSVEANNIGATIDISGKITFADSDAKIGKIKVTVTRAADEKYKACSNEFTLEIKYPTVPTTAYIIDKTVNENGWYDSDIKITAPEGYTVSYDNELSTNDWASDVIYATEGTTAPVIYLKADNGDITDAITVAGYKMDKTEPTGLSISYDLTIWETILEKVFGFNAEKVTVTLKAEDAVSGVDYVWYSLDNGTTYPDSQKVELVDGEHRFVIPAEFRNIVKFKAVDMAGKTSELSDGKTIVVDSVSPELTVGYEHSGFNRVSNDIIFANGDVKINFTLEAANFDLSVAPVIKVNEKAQDVSWSSEANIHKTSVTLTDTGDYIVTFSFTDRLDRTQTYSKEIHVDKVKPVISDFVFAPGEVKDSVSKRNYYDVAQTVKVVITEHNFDPTTVALEVSSDNAAVDADKYATDFAKRGAWTHGANDTWTAEIPFTADANYTVKLAYTDLAGNSKTSDVYEFTVDTTDPIKPTIKLDKAILAKVVETITFGFFKAPIEVTVTSGDITAGVKEIKYSYVGKNGEYNEAVVNVGATIATDNDTIKFTIPADTEFKGIVSATAYDWSHNASEEQNITFDKNDEQLNVIVVDNKAPERTVLITEATRVVDATTLKDVANYDYTKENTNSILYYNDKATLTFLIDEANFFSEDVHVFVNGNETNPTDWAIENNKWKGTITLEDEGDYVVTMTYTDKSENVMTTYKSERIVIDKTNPVISVEYHNKNTINTIDGREYYDGTQTATIKVVEHNFRADDFKVKVFAKDINGNNVLEIDESGYVKTYAENGAKRTEWSDYTANWRRVDDTYQLNITYSADANYTFDAEYIDLAKRSDDSNVNKEFTVDTTATHTLNVEYSTNIVDEILSTIFFYNPKATVKVSATDDVAGIEYFNIGVKKDGLTEATNIELPENLVVNADGSVKSGSKGFIGEITSTKENGKIVLSFEVPEQFRGEFIVESVTDLSHNVSDKYDDDKIVVVDSVSPDVKVEFTGSLKDKIDTDLTGTEPTRQTKDTTDKDTRFVYDGDITATITVKEANFYDDMVITVYRDGAAVNDSVISEWVQVANTYEYVKTIKLSKDGDYQIKLDYEDKSDNKMDVDATGEYAENSADKVGTYTSNIHTIDTTIPTYTITYENNNVIHTIDGRDYFNANRTATIKVTDRNFRPNEVDFKVVTKDIFDKDVPFNYSNLTSWSDWTSEDNLTWTATVLFGEDANYTVNFTYSDIAGHKVADDYNAKFTVDKTDAANIKIEYSESIVDKVLETITFGFYQGDVVVTVTAEDMTSGVDFFEITYTAVDGDNNSNKATYKTEKLEAKQDATSRNVFRASHTITAQARGTVSVDVTDKAANDSSKEDNKVLVADTTVPGIVVDYTFVNDQVREYNNIYYTQNKTGIKFTITEANFDIAEKPVVTVNGAPETVEWIQTANTDEWVGNITLTENGDYKVKVTFADSSTNAMTTYEKEIHIDNAKPAFDIIYDNNTAANVNNYNADRTATIKLTEHNFKAEEVELKVTAKDITGKAIDLSEKAYNAYAKKPENWTKVDDVWTLNTVGMKFDIDGIYTVTLNYTDLAENVADGYATEFVIDHNAPTDLKITYSTSLLEKIINTVTFGYYQPSVTVTLTAADDISGVDYFNWSYTKEEGSSNKNADDIARTITSADILYSNNGKTATATFTIPANARGYISAIATDRATNADSKVDDKYIVVVDNIAPTRTVEFAPERILDATTLLDVSTFSEGDDVILYYKDSATVTFKIDEANFYEEDVVIKVSKNGAVATPVAPTDWTQSGDVWTGTVTLSGDGDYVVTMTYADRSTNDMVAYESQEIRIDATAPVINVAYNPNDATANGKYCNCDREATITVTEHNFRAEDVVATITAKDVTGANVTITDFDAYLKNRANWTTVGDVHTAKITFTTDAQYTFKFDSKDIIGNEATQYVAPDFAVDHTKPTELTITYGTSIADKVFETITFGFYKADVAVTLTADDITSGIDYFEYKYVKESGTSDVNEASSADWIKLTPEASEYTNDGKTATVSFNIPASIRGYITARVFDRATNVDTISDNNIINVVDNIKPGITVNYVADDANTKVQYTDDADVTKNSFAEGTTAYFNGNVRAKITINEANFFEGKVTDSGEIIHNVGILLTKTDDNGMVTRMRNTDLQLLQTISTLILLHLSLFLLQQSAMKTAAMKQRLFRSEI